MDVSNSFLDINDLLNQQAMMNQNRERAATADKQTQQQKEYENRMNALYALQGGIGGGDTSQTPRMTPTMTPAGQQMVPQVPGGMPQLPVPQGPGQILAQQQWEAMAAAKEKAAEEKLQKQAKVYEDWAKALITNTKDMVGQDANLSPVYKSIIGAFKKTNNPYLVTQAEAMDESGVQELYKPKALPKAPEVKTDKIFRMVGGKPHTILVNKQTGEDIKDMGEAKGASAYGNGRYVATDEEVKYWADAVRAKRVTLEKVPSYGGLRAKVVPAVERATKNGEPINYTADIFDAKTAGATQAFVDKQLNMSESFISTIDANIAMFNDHIREMAKTHAMPENKIMNMGVREYLKLVGDSDVNIYDMLINAISTENAKLVSGGAGSVAQVAEGARTEMDKIHNKNLPMKDMVKLLESTRREGQNRVDALTKQREKAGAKVRETRDIKPKGVPSGAQLLKGKDGKLLVNSNTGNGIYALKGAYWDAKTGRRLSKDGK